MVAFIQLCQSLSNSHHDCFTQSKNSWGLSLNSKKLIVKKWVWHIFICRHVFWWSFNMQFSPKVEPSWYVKMTPKCALLTWKILFHLHYIGVTPFKNMAMSSVITLWELLAKMSNHHLQHEIAVMSCHDYPLTSISLWWWWVWISIQ
jgi:hypothetical protein